MTEVQIAMSAAIASVCCLQIVSTIQVISLLPAVSALVHSILGRVHTYASCAVGVQGSLAGLYRSIEARVALYKPLVSLQGRLDLLLAQAPSVDPLASHLTAGPLVSLLQSAGLQRRPHRKVSSHIRRLCQIRSLWAASAFSKCNIMCSYCRYLMTSRTTLMRMQLRILQLCKLMMTCLQTVREPVLLMIWRMMRLMKI